jgi:phage shock protein PspC (stress-responsive transcriptional regulator)
VGVAKIATEWRSAARCAATWKEYDVLSTLTRPRHGKVIAGVCAGLAERFGVSVTLIRFLFLIFIPLAGSPTLLYIVLWILMPKRPY